jgi:putative FmdB family regulatory protein
MPIYEYACDACGHTFEQWQKITEAAVKECPVCHQLKVERLISLSSFALKGSGWYATDYKSGGATGPSSEGKSTVTETKTESKSEAKT